MRTEPQSLNGGESGSSWIRLVTDDPGDETRPVPRVDLLSEREIDQLLERLNVREEARS